ncbi:porin family protein [Sphingomonas sp. KRR8]|uniref:outer membrane protein n=1 Tax=Sphingomonas sp. KRR8 TaxID=2942996 RepID=UPI00202078AA|nr:outer membrane beta-barrel protein [Sphingomonas sp. KRR8]URD60981.1 porin family protein [Sphingomonas sp. KRR8]
MNNLHLVTALAAVTVGAPVMAQDTAAAAEAPHGARIEAVVGVDHVRLDLRDFGLGHVTDGGLLYGVGAGFDFPVGDAVSVGADVEASDSTLKFGDSGVYVKSGRDLYAGGRFSFAIGEGSNVYVKAGYTNARFKATDGTDSASGNGDGFRAGIGAQAKLMGKTYAGLEYRYSNYEGGLIRHQGVVVIGTRF